MDVVRRGEPSSLFQLEEQAKKYYRGIRKSLRELDRLYRILDRSEKEKMAEIKTAMKDGRTDTVERLMPPLDGRIKGHKRGGIIQLLKMNAHMGSVLLQISTLQSSEEMVAAMKYLERRSAELAPPAARPRRQLNSSASSVRTTVARRSMRTW